MYRAGLVIREKLAKNDAGRQAQIGLALSYGSVGKLLSNGNKYEDALAAFRKQVEVVTKLLSAEPGNEGFQAALSDTYEEIGQQLLSMERRQDAIGAYRESLALRETLAAAAPRDITRARSVWLSNLSIGHALGLLEKPDEALKFYRTSAGLSQQILSWAPPAETWWMQVMTEQYLGDAFIALGRESDAVAAHEQSVAIARRQVAQDPKDPRAQKRLQAALGKLASAYLAFGKAENAFRAYDEAVRLAPEDADAYRNRGRAAFHARRVTAAIDDFAAAVKLDPKDAYAALWLHVARARVGQADAAELAANAERLDHSQWPWPVVEFYLGHSAPETLEAAANSSEDPGTRKGHGCEANFYAGAIVLNTRRKEAQRLLSSAVQACPHRLHRIRCCQARAEPPERYRTQISAWVFTTPSFPIARPKTS